MSKNEVLAAPVLIVEGSEGPVIAEALESSDDLVPWLRGKPGSERMINALGKAHEFSGFDSPDEESWLVRRQQLATTRVVEDLKSLAEHTGLDMGSEEFYLRAIQPSHPLERPVFDPMSLCSTPGGGCTIPGVDWLPMSGGLWHDLRYVWPFGDWNDRAVSYRVSGFATVFEDIHFGGASLFLTGHPGYAHDLEEWGWANRISSAIVA